MFKLPGLRGAGRDPPPAVRNLLPLLQRVLGRSLCREAQARIETRRLKLAAEAELNQRTLDEYRPGEQQSEVEHNLRGENTFAGQFQGQKLHSATNGGWFSFELAISPSGVNELTFPSDWV